MSAKPVAIKREILKIKNLLKQHRTPEALMKLDRLYENLDNVAVSEICVHAETEEDDIRPEDSSHTA